jgi:hypothetical protein
MQWLEQALTDQVDVFGYEFPGWQLVVVALAVLLVLWAWSSSRSD